MLKSEPREHRFVLCIVFHSIGMSCLAGGVFLELLVFFGIQAHGIFIGIENNPLVLKSEIGLALFSCIYLFFVSTQKIRALSKKGEKGFGDY